MPDLDDAVGDMVTDLHAEAGRPFTYRRGGVSLGTVTLSRHQQQSQQVIDGNGGITEITPVDFIGKTASLPVDPLRDDKIVDDINETTLERRTVPVATYEVRPTTGEKVSRKVSPQMTRIHTKQVAN